MLRNISVLQEIFVKFLKLKSYCDFDFDSFILFAANKLATLVTLFYIISSGDLF